MRTLNTYLVILFFTLISCAPQMSAVWEKEDYQPRAFDKIAVISISNNLEVRENLDRNMIQRINEILPYAKFISGMELIPPNLGKDSWSKESITKLLLDNNVDALIVSAIVSNYISDNYVSGDHLYMPTYYRAGRHIYSTYSSIHTTGYYEQSNNYVLESVIFDLKEGSDADNALIWRGQSEVSDPTSISKGAVTYAQNLAKYLDKYKVLSN